MEKELKIRDIEHLNVPDMVQEAEVKFMNVLLLLETAIHEARPKGEDAIQSISYVNEFNDTLVTAYEKAKGFIWSIEGH